MRDLIDLTMPFSSCTIPVPGHPQPAFESLHELERDGVRNTIMRISIHTGTHIDAPSHFIEDGDAIDDLPLDRFHRPGREAGLDRCARPGEPIAAVQLEAVGFDTSDPARQGFRAAVPPSPS